MIAQVMSFDDILSSKRTITIVALERFLVTVWKDQSVFRRITGISESIHASAHAWLDARPGQKTFGKKSIESRTSLGSV